MVMSKVENFRRDVQTMPVWIQLQQIIHRKSRKIGDV